MKAYIPLYGLVRYVQRFYITSAPVVYYPTAGDPFYIDPQGMGLSRASPMFAHLQYMFAVTVRYGILKI